MQGTRLGRRAVKHRSLTRAGYFRGFRAAVASFLIFLGLKRGRQDIGIAPWGFGELDILCGSGKEKVAAV